MALASNENSYPGVFAYATKAWIVHFLACR